jgi:hypothetical protein
MALCVAVSLHKCAGAISTDALGAPSRCLDLDLLLVVAGDMVRAVRRDVAYRSCSGRTCFKREKTDRWLRGAVVGSTQQDIQHRGRGDDWVSEGLGFAARI